MNLLLIMQQFSFSNLVHLSKCIIIFCHRDQMKCVSCESKIEGAPVRLPCDHILCRRCFFDCLTLKEFVCQYCNEKFPHNLDPDKSDNE